MSKATIDFIYSWHSSVSVASYGFLWGWHPTSCSGLPKGLLSHVWSQPHRPEDQQPRCRPHRLTCEGGGAPAVGHHGAAHKCPTHWRNCTSLWTQLNIWMGFSSELLCSSLFSFRPSGRTIACRPSRWPSRWHRASTRWTRTARWRSPSQPTR